MLQKDYFLTKLALVLTPLFSVSDTATVEVLGGSLVGSVELFASSWMAPVKVTTSSGWELTRFFTSWSSFSPLELSLWSGDWFSSSSSSASTSGSSTHERNVSNKATVDGTLRRISVLTILSNCQTRLPPVSWTFAEWNPTYVASSTKSFSAYYQQKSKNNLNQNKWDIKW